MSEQLAGFRLLSVQTVMQHYEVRDASEFEDGTPDSRDFAFSWDWTLLGDDRFNVLIAIQVRGNKSVPDEARVALLGVFQYGEPTTVKVLDFVKLGAPAILFPYAREVIATLTSKGLATYHLPTFNIYQLMRSQSLNDSSGYKQILADSALARKFDVVVQAQLANPD